MLEGRSLYPQGMSLRSVAAIFHKKKAAGKNRRPVCVKFSLISAMDAAIRSTYV